MRLNNTQTEAVKHPQSLSLVSCPGSGKTRTLVAKLLETMEAVRASTRQVACITYTNTAVHEIENRLAILEPDASRLCEVETIHTFCLKHVVGPHAWHIPEFKNGFSILPPDDPAFQELIERIAGNFGLGFRATSEFAQLTRGSEVLPESIPKSAANEFWRVLDERHQMDFSSIIYWSAKLISLVPYIARGLASRYEWLLVDEFQDTSTIQVEVLRVIHKHGRTCVFMVGDPEQSIMSFAGAKPSLLVDFAKEIGARSDLTLLDNYRSSKRILRVADSLLPRTGPMVAQGDARDYDFEPVWHTVETMSIGITDVFLPEVNKRGIPASETAVLANRWTSLIPIARALVARGLPAVGPGARPYRRSTHVVAPLVEELAAYATSPTANNFGYVRSELRRLIQSVTGDTRLDPGFIGDIAAVSLAKSLAKIDGAEPAEAFLHRFATSIRSELQARQLVNSSEAELLSLSALAMTSDIAEHEKDLGLSQTTVANLGLFGRGGKSIRLLTMHGAKGREFDAVALVDLFDGHVPFFKAKPGDEIEAEGRRLLYVALTRPRKLLMLFTLQKPSERKQPSRFLKGIFPKGPSS